MINILKNFLNIFRRTKIPKNYKFRGYLDSPPDFEHTSIAAGWYISKKPFYKIMVCLAGEEIFRIKPNTARKDVTRAYPGASNPDNKNMSGYKYEILKGIIRKHLLAKNEKKAEILIRFYLDNRRFVDKYRTRFVLRNNDPHLITLKRTWRERLLSFLGIFGKIGIPGSYEFLGHLDSPKEGKFSNTVSGWYLSKGPFYKVVLCLNGREIIKIERNMIRKDVAFEYMNANYVNADNSGFNYRLPRDVITSVLGKSDKKPVILSIRFYIDKNRYVEKFRTKFVLYENEYDLFRKDRENEYSKIDLKKGMRKFRYKPKISVVVPVYRPSREHFIQMIRSVLGQVYPNLEFCVYFDGRQPELENILKGMKDNRIRVAVNEKNKGISAATNRALSLATGEFVAFVDHDDILHKFALFEIVLELNKNKNVDLIYTDEDKIDDKDRHFMPFFKPDFSPHQLLCNNYICHLLVARKSVVDALGGFRENAGIDGRQDWDLILRILERTKRVLHIPKVLYSWRYYKKSVSQEKKAKERYLSSSKKVLSDFIERNKLRAKVKGGLVADTYKVDHDIIGNPKVSIIIPTGNLKLLKNVIKSIFKKTSYPNYEVIIIDNSPKCGTKVTAVRKAMLKMRSYRIRYFRNDLKPFNFSALINFGARKAKGEYLLLLNEDMEVIGKKWMTEMLKMCQQKDVGAVGAKLYYGNDTIQHVGVVFGLFDICEHIFKGRGGKDPGYFGSNYLIKDYLAVTGACLMTKKDLFWQVKGLDEKNLKIAYQDIDYCARLHEKGYCTVFTPYAELYHFEGITRIITKTRSVAKGEFEYFTKKWAKYIENDPFYNPNLSKGSLEYKLDVN